MHFDPAIVSLYQGFPKAFAGFGSDFFLLWASTLQVFRFRCPCLCICVESYVNWGDRTTHAGKNERARQVYTTRTFPRFQSMPTEQDTGCYGTKPNLLTEEAIGTQRK